MTIEGELVVRLAWSDHRVRDVAIRSTRPLAAPAVLKGRPIGEAIAIVPRLYSVCANAQGAAAAGALAAAVGERDGGAERSRRSIAVVLESIQEQLRRLLIDLPPLQGLPAVVPPVATARRAIAKALGTGDIVAGTGHGIADVLAQICDDHLLGMPVERWAEQRDVDEVGLWAKMGATTPARVVQRWLETDARLGASDVAPLPAVDRGGLEAGVLAPLRNNAAFAAAPHWYGAPAETGPWARLSAHPLVDACARAFGNSVVTRTIARLTEVAGDVARLRRQPPDVIDAWSPAQGEGACAVQTARGLLIHAAAVDDGRVVRYAIVAPTEWNFRPGGALARGLAGITDADASSLELRARQFVHVLDPCVSCAVEVGHA